MPIADHTVAVRSAKKLQYRVTTMFKKASKLLIAGAFPHSPYPNRPMGAYSTPQVVGRGLAASTQNSILVL